MTTVEPAAVIDATSIGQIGLTTDGTTVWAATDGEILRIDAATNAVERFEAPTQADDTTMAIADDGLWVTRWAGGHLYRLDPTTGAVELSVDMPQAVKIAFIDDDLWVGLEGTDEMALVDRETGAIGRSVDAGAYGMAGLGDLWFNPDMGTTIERVDPASGSVIATIEGQGEGNCILSGAFPDSVWSSCFGRPVIERSATRIDPASNTVATVATLPPMHGGSVVVADGDAWFVGSLEDANGQPFGGLLRLDPDSGAIEKFVSIGPADPSQFVVAGGAIWLSDEALHRVLRVDLADLAD